MAYGPKKLSISYSNPNLTHFGGLWLIQSFFRHLNLRRRLQRAVPFIQRNNHYSCSEIILSLIYPFILGLGRLESTKLLRHNGVFQYLTGLLIYPNPVTLRRFLIRMPQKVLQRLRHFHATLLTEMVHHPRSPTSIIFDLDSTVLTVYGKLEGAKRGYNPFKKGRASYHPLVCFEGITKDYWDGEFREGNVHTGSGALSLLKTCFSRIPQTVRSVRIRADVGFYDHKVVEWLEEKKVGYVIVAKMTKPIQNRLSGLRFRKTKKTLAFAEFTYQPAGWEEPHRFVAMRKPLAELASPQMTLFTMKKYAYHVYVTNLHMKPINIWKFYNGRAAVEVIIKELKHDYFLTKIPTRSFMANTSYFHILMLTYNLINWFKRLCLPREFQNKTINTIRSQLIFIPAELTRSQNKPTLKLPKQITQRKLFDATLKNIKKIKWQN